MEAKLQRWRQDGHGKTKYFPVPRGDVSVMPDSTRVTVGWVPTDRLDDFLDPANEPPAHTEPPPVYARPEPGPHPADAGKQYKCQEQWGSTLRRVIHTQLVDDLERLGLSTENVRLDFARARSNKGSRTASAHEGTFTALNGVRVIDTEMDIAIHKGAVDFVRDVNAEEFHCWWAGSGIPEAMWRDLDMGVQRRMVDAGHWDGDPLIEHFRQQNNPEA